jgi:hypothetical protein
MKPDPERGCGLILLALLALMVGGILTILVLKLADWYR